MVGCQNRVNRLLGLCVFDKMDVIYCRNGEFKVQSETFPSKFYMVDMKYGTDGICNCLGFFKNKIICKHIKKVKERMKDNLIGINF